MACGAGIPQRRGGDRVRGTSVVRRVVPVGSVGADRLVDRSLSGECAYGLAPRAVSVGLVSWPVAPAFSSGLVDRLGLLVYQAALCEGGG